MRSLPHLAALALSLAPLFAQAKIKALGGEGPRSNTAVILADTSSGFNVLALLTITHGIPEWKPEYTDKADALTKGKIFRLGRDNWAVYDSTAAVKFGNVTVPAGVYYLAIARTADGSTWNMVFLDPAKTKAAGAWPFAPEPAPHAFEVPLTHERTEGKITEKLVVALASDKTQPTHGTLTITWGDRKLTGSYDIVLDSKAQPKNAAADKGNDKGK